MDQRAKLQNNQLRSFGYNEVNKDSLEPSPTNTINGNKTRLPDSFIKNMPESSSDGHGSLGNHKSKTGIIAQIANVQPTGNPLKNPSLVMSALQKNDSNYDDAYQMNRDRNRSKTTTGKFKGAVETIRKINRTQIAMQKVKHDEALRIKQIMESKIKENFIIKQVESENQKNGPKKKRSMFIDELDEEWDDFITRRTQLLPELPKIEHGHGGHGHHAGPVDHDKIPRFIFRCNDTWVFWWDITVLVLAIIICFMLPVEIAYHAPFGKTSGWHIFEYTVEALFALDVLFHFNTTIYDSDGNEIFDRKHLAIDYLCEMHFWIDMAATFPFNKMSDNAAAKLAPTLKVIRITALSQIIKKLSVRDETKALIKACQLIFYLIIYIHMKACIWFYMTRESDTWLPPMFWQSPVDSEELLEHFFGAGNYGQQYLVSVYYSVLMLKPNEIAPRADNETIICAVILLIDLIVAANIYGGITVLVQMAGRRSQKFQRQIDNANTAMKDMSIPGDVQGKVREFLVLIQSTREQQEELQKFYDMISPSLKQKVAIEIFSTIIRSNIELKKVIKSKMDEIKDDNNVSVKLTTSRIFKQRVKEVIISLIASQLTTQLNKPEDVIIHQYEEMTEKNEMYLIARGECMVNIKDENNKVIRGHKILQATEFFGEIGLIYGCKRTATVVSRKYTTLAILSKPKFQMITTEFPKFKEILKRSIFKHNDRMKKFMKQCLRKIEYFQGISEDALHDVMYHMDLKHYNEGDELQSPGDKARSLYFIQDGIVEVSALFDENHFVIERLHRGSIINFRNWFMDDEDAHVYIKFATNAIVQELDIDIMNKICSYHPKDLEEKFLKYQTTISKTNLSYPLDYIMNLPPELRNTQLSVQKQQLAWKLENLQKNIVMRRIHEIKQFKKKPGLKEAIQIILREKAKRDEKLRAKLKDKVMDLYEKEIQHNLSEEDRRFSRILLQIDRLHKILAAQSTQVINLEKKILGRPALQNQPSIKAQPSNTISKAPSIKNEEKKKSENQKQLETYQEFFETSKLGSFPRYQDDNLSDSSEDEKNQLLQLDDIQTIAVKEGALLSLQLDKRSTLVSRQQ